MGNIGVQWLDDTFPEFRNTQERFVRVAWCVHEHRSGGLTMKHPSIEKLEKQALLDRIAELEKRIEKLEKKNERL